MLCNWNLNSDIHVLSVYRAPRGNFERFLNKLENINYLYKSQPKFVISGDIKSDQLSLNKKDSEFHSKFNI
jgi:hypothetical protein